MKTPVGTKVDLGSCHIVLHVVTALSERGIGAPPPFSAHIYCGHGRPSQLLLSSCTLHFELEGLVLPQHEHVRTVR